MVYDLYDTYQLFIYCFLIALGASLVLMVLMLFLASIVVWLIFLGAIGVMIAFGILMLLSLYNPGSLNDGINAARVKYLSFLKINQTWLTIIAVFSLVLGVVILFLMIKWAKTINKVIALMRQSYKISLRNSLLIFLSLFIIVL